MDFLAREIGDCGPEKEGHGQDDSGNIVRETKEKELDLLPEYCRYKDEGCQYAESCLSCPFPQCLFDEPRGRQRWLKGIRNREISRLYFEGWDIPELAMLFGVSQRTIQRAVNSQQQVPDRKQY